VDGVGDFLVAGVEEVDFAGDSELAGGDTHHIKYARRIIIFVVGI
jgi:hypothetical protein